LYSKDTGGFTISGVYVKVTARPGNGPTDFKTPKIYIKGEKNENGACGIECFRSRGHGRVV
jgi:hypothetical protein